MRIRSNRLQIVLVGEESVRRSDKTVAKIRSHRHDHIFLPQKTMPAARAKVRDAKPGHATQSLDLAPQLCLGPRIENVEPELAQRLQLSARFQLVQDRERIEFPHRGLGPGALECQVDLAVLYRQVIVREAEVAFQPLQKCGLEDSAAAIER